MMQTLLSTRMDESQIRMSGHNNLLPPAYAPQRPILLPIIRTAFMASSTETAAAYGFKRVYELHMRAISLEPSISRLTSS